MSFESSLFAANTPPSGGGMDLGGMLGLGGVTSAIGDITNSIFANQTNAASSNMQDKQIAWDNQWRSNAHQTEVADLKAAGLNPILSAGGGGASTPSIGSAPQVAPQISMPDVLGGVVSMTQLQQAQQKINIDKANSEAAIRKNLSDAQLNDLQSTLAKQGYLGKTFGTDMMTNFSNGLNNFIKGLMSPRHTQTEQPSSGGSIPRAGDANLEPLDKFGFPQP